MESPILAAGMNAAGIDEGRKDRVKVILKIIGKLKKRSIFLDAEFFEDTFEREVSQEKERGLFRDLPDAVLLFKTVKSVNLSLIKREGISHSFFHEGF